MNPTPTNEIQELPRSWPGAFGLYNYSKQAVTENMGTIIILILVSLGFGLVPNFFHHHASTSFADALRYQSPSGLIQMVAGALLTSSLAVTQLAGIRRKKVPFGEAIAAGVTVWLKMIVLTLLLYVTYIASLILLIVPFFFVYPRFEFARYFLVDKKMGVLEAYKASWEATRGQAMNIWGIIGVNILIGLLVITLIGIPFALYFYIMYSAAIAVLYEMTNRRQSGAPTALPV